MQVELICDSDRLRQFAPEWSAFVRQQQNVTPFQLPDWLMTWWSHFGSGTPYVIAFRERDLVGVMPCFLHEWNGLRQLTLMGSGISDYLDPIFAPCYESAIVDCLREHITSNSSWDICDWQDISNNTPLLALAGQGLDARVTSETPCSESALEDSYENFWQQRPHQIHRNVRRYTDKAKQSGTLQFSVTSTADPDLLDALIALHAARWQARGESGMIEANRSKDFLLDIVSQLADQDFVRIFSLQYEGNVAAILLGFAYEGTLYGYLTAFDPTHAQLRLGLVLLSEAFRECYRQSFRTWNFCRGDEAYKLLWGAQFLPRCRINLSHKR